MAADTRSRCHDLLAPFHTAIVLLFVWRLELGILVGTLIRRCICCFQRDSDRAEHRPFPLQGRKSERPLFMKLFCWTQSIRFRLPFTPPSTCAWYLLLCSLPNPPPPSGIFRPGSYSPAEFATVRSIFLLEKTSIHAVENYVQDELDRPLYPAARWAGKAPPMRWYQEILGTPSYPDAEHTQYTLSREH